MSIKGFITWMRRRTADQPLTLLECIDLSCYDAATRGRIERGEWPERLYLKPGFHFQPFIEIDRQQSGEAGRK